MSKLPHGIRTWLRDHARTEAPIAFPNRQAQRTVGRLIGKPHGDILPADVAALTALDLSEHALSDIGFLRHFRALETLRLPGNAIGDLSPLARLTSLTSLRLFHNRITELAPLARLTALRFLDLSENPISDLSPIAHLPAKPTLRSEEGV